MRRYVSQPRARYSHDLDMEVPELVGMTVLEPEPCLKDTGILDASGNPIYVEDRLDPIGFVRFF